MCKESMDCIRRVWTVYRESLDCAKGEYGLCKEREWTGKSESVDCV